MSEAKKNLHLTEGAALAGAVLMVPLSVLWAYANFWAFNHIAGEYIDFSHLAVDYVVTLLASVVVFLSCFWITRFRSAVRALFMTGAFLLMFFSYHHFANAIPKEPVFRLFLQISDWLTFTLFFVTAIPTDLIFLQIYAWLAATLLVCSAAYSLAKFQGFRMFALIVLPLTSIGVVLDAVGQRSAIHLEDKPGHVEPAPDVTHKPWRGVDLIKPDGLIERRPNVYYLMVDSHLRNDAFRKFYQGDYSDFISYLESNGFFVGKKSHSNFPVTLYSVSSTLNMDFIVTEGPKGIHNTTARGYDMLAGRNPVAAAFRARGYRILYTMNGFLPPNVCSGFEDRCIRKKGRFVTLQELALVRLTPLIWVLNRVEPNWRKASPGDLLPDLRDGTVAYFHSYQPKDIPGDIPPKAEWPFFWHVHFMGMHNLAFDSDCDYQHPKHILARKPKPTRPFMQIAYREQVACLHKQLRVAVDAILAADPGAIIALQSDHGSTMVNNMRPRPASEWTEDDIFEVFSVLNSVRVPENCRSRLYDSISLVNTFRVILGCLDDKDYELLPDDMYVAAYPGWWPDFPRVTKIEARGQIVGEQQ